MNQISHKSDLFQNTGLLVEEILHDAKTSNFGPSIVEEVYSNIQGQSIYKNSFVLNRMLYTTNGIAKKTNIPNIVRTNFPSEKTLSDILGVNRNGKTKISTSHGYDAIRKTLVLLHFYTYWLKQKVHNSSDDGNYNLYQIYLDESKDCLKTCGYEPLYPGNPYDWIFLYASANYKTENPLDFFRVFIGDFVDIKEV